MRGLITVSLKIFGTHPNDNYTLISRRVYHITYSWPVETLSKLGLLHTLIKALPLHPFILLHSELLGTLSSLFLFLCVVSLISTWVLHSIEPAVLYVVTLSYFGFDTFFICFFKYCTSFTILHWVLSMCNLLSFNNSIYEWLFWPQSIGKSEPPFYVACCLKIKARLTILLHRKGCKQFVYKLLTLS